MSKLLRRLKRRMGQALSKFFSKIGNGARSIRNNKKTIALTIFKLTMTAGSAALTVYVLDYFLPLWLTAAIASTVFIHELGHYFTALRLHRKADPPLFLPFIWGVVGGTRIHNRGSSPEADAQIHLAGPTWGFIWASAGAAFAAYFRQMNIMWAFIWLGAFNLWHGTLGSDGKFYQTMKSQSVPDSTEEPIHVAQDPRIVPSMP